MQFNGASANIIAIQEDSFLPFGDTLACMGGQMVAEFLWNSKQQFAQNVQNRCAKKANIFSSDGKDIGGKND